nr:peptidoglycan DD-metalloendopeptidase family protein [uncultured Kingella sp.]
MNKLLALLLCTALISPYAFAAPAPSADTELGNVRNAIAAAEKDLQAKQAAQAKAQRALREAQAAIARTRREIARLNSQEQAGWQKLSALQAELSKLQTNISSTKAQVAALIAANYKNPQQAAFALLLKNADANQKSRFLAYTRRISAANEHLIRQLATQQAELNAQEKAVSEEIARIGKLTAERQEKLRRLGKTQSEAQTESKKLNQSVAESRQKLARLQENERRLNQIIAGIAAKQAAQRKAEAAQKEQEARKRAENPKSTLTREDLALRPESPESPAKPLRGIMPVSGSITGRFGTARESGGTWRGIFISAAAAPVRSIADGTVVYAASQSGYGNMMIVDHGSGYMSVYAGLGSIGASNGSRVRAGQQIATSGTMPAGEQGLYLELRYKGRVMNPTVWLR